jgi:hypothetical protein
MGRLFVLAASIFAIVNGVGVLRAENCSSISFDGEAGGRVLTAVCFPDSTGAIPASLAGWGMVLIGVAVLLVAVASFLA